MLVLIAHGFTELVVNALIDHHCKNAKKISDDSRSFPHSAKLLILNELGVLSDHHYKLLDWFRKLRNDFAHKPLFTLTPDRLAIFAKPEDRDPAKFRHLCFGIVLDLWHHHQAVFGINFLPSFYTTVKESVLMVEVPAPEELLPLTSDPKTIHMTADEYDAMKAAEPVRPVPVPSPSDTTPPAGPTGAERATRFIADPSRHGYHQASADRSGEQMPEHAPPLTN